MADVRRANFELQKQTGLKEVDINRRTQKNVLSSGLRNIDFRKTTGLRDIGQARTEGLRGVVNNALQRGIFKSGIRVENEAKVERESGEAKSDLITQSTNQESDLRSQVGFALEHLANRENFLRNQQLQPLGGSGGSSIGAALQRLIEELFRLAGGDDPSLGEAFPDIGDAPPAGAIGINRPTYDFGGGVIAE